MRRLLPVLLICLLAPIAAFSQANPLGAHNKTVNELPQCCKALRAGTRS